MTMCVTVHVIKQPEKSLSVQLTLVWGLDIPAFLNVECIAWYLVWFATPTSRKPHLVLPSGVMEYLVRVETGDEGSCTYSRFLWVNMPPEVPDTDLRTSEGAQESSPRIKNIIVAQCFHWRRFYTITEGNGFSFVTSLTSFLTLHTCPCWFHFYLHFSLENKTKAQRGRLIYTHCLPRKSNQGISDPEPVIFLLELHASLPCIFF